MLQPTDGLEQFSAAAHCTLRIYGPCSSPASTPSSATLSLNHSLIYLCPKNLDLIHIYWVEGISRNGPEGFPYVVGTFTDLVKWSVV